MICAHCSWQNAAGAVTCELCGRSGEVRRQPAAQFRTRLDYQEVPEEAPNGNPLFREVMQQGLHLCQGKGSITLVRCALDRFWEELERFLRNDLPALLNTTRGARSELARLSRQADTELRQGCENLDQLLTGWPLKPQPQAMAEAMMKIQGGLNLLAQCQALDENR